MYDLKTGHTPVTVPGNTQAMFYALGALRYLMDEGHRHLGGRPVRMGAEQGLDTVRIGIYQPKVFASGSGGLGVHDGGSAAVRHAGAQQGRERAQRRGDARQDPDGRKWDRTFPNQNPNEEECAFCRAMPTCPSAQRKVVEVVAPTST